MEEMRFDPNFENRQTWKREEGMSGRKKGSRYISIFSLPPCLLFLPPN